MWWAKLQPCSRPHNYKNKKAAPNKRLKILKHTNVY